MGQAVTRIFRTAKREVGMYDIERRAQKVISADKPTAAPKYPSTIRELKNLEKDDVSKDYLYKKDDKLDDRLKKVFVTSQDNVLPAQRIIPPDRPLPQARYRDQNVYGYSESEEVKVPVGLISLKQALDLIVEHKSDPVVNSKPALADKYKMNETTIGDILEYFKMFNFHTKKALEAGPQNEHQKLQKKIEELNLRNAGSVVEAIRDWERKYKGSGKNDIVKTVKDIKDKASSNKETNKDNR